MTDVGTHHFVKAGSGDHSVLVPQPSDDPHDPLVSLLIHETSRVPYVGEYMLRSCAQIELDSLLESGNHILLDIGNIRARHGTFGASTHVSVLY